MQLRVWSLGFGVSGLLRVVVDWEAGGLRALCGCRLPWRRTYMLGILKDFTKVSKV